MCSNIYKSSSLTSWIPSLTLTFTLGQTDVRRYFECECADGERQPVRSQGVRIPSLDVCSAISRPSLAKYSDWISGSHLDLGNSPMSAHDEWAEVYTRRSRELGIGFGYERRSKEVSRRSGPGASIFPPRFDRNTRRNRFVARIGLFGSSGRSIG